MATSFVGPADIQLALTLVLFVLSWTLDHTGAGKREFRWWTWGWLAFAGGMVVFRVTVLASLDNGRNPLELVGSQGGLLQVTLFGLGVYEMRRGVSPSRRTVILALLTTSLLALGLDLSLPSLQDQATVAIAGRVAPRGLGMAAVFGACALQLLRRREGRPDLATLVTASSFALYGANQAVYGGMALHQLLTVVGGGDPSGVFLAWYGSGWAFAWDTVWQAGIGLGYYLLLTTEHRRTYEALLVSEERFRRAFASAPVGMALLGPEGTILRANEALARLVAFGPDELPGLALDEFVRPEDRGRLTDSFGSGTGVDGASAPVGLFTRTGQARQVLVHVAEVGGTDQRIAQLLDVTEWVRLERELRQTQKRKATSRMAAGLAHDFNNLLTGILGNIELLRQDLPPDSSARVFVEEVATAAHKAARLTRQMLVYLGQLGGRRHALDLGDAVRKHCEELRCTQPASVKLRYSPGAAELPPVSADPELVAEVLEILVGNGADAIGERRGTVEVRTDQKSTLPGGLVADYTPEPAPDGFVVLSVSDDGEGIHPSIEDQIFDPFFSTRFTGRGLGLATLMGILRVHEAAVSVRSVPGKGTTFSVYFPGTPST